MNKLEELRKEIDALDIELVDVIARRFDVVRAVGRLKAEQDIAVVQPARAQAVKNRAAEMGAAKGLNPDFVRRIYDVMIDYAHHIEDEILDDAKDV